MNTAIHELWLSSFPSIKMAHETSAHANGDMTRPYSTRPNRRVVCMQPSLSTPPPLCATVKLCLLAPPLPRLAGGYCVYARTAHTNSSPVAATAIAMILYVCLHPILSAKSTQSEAKPPPSICDSISAPVAVETLPSS